MRVQLKVKRSGGLAWQPEERGERKKNFSNVRGENCSPRQKK